MSYASGGLIQAADFNGLASTTAYTSSTNTGGNVAWVWGTGFGNTGYGQSTTLLSSVSASSVITATQWAGLVYTINNALAHQNAATIGGGPLGANINMTAGQTITYFANVASAVTTVNNLPGKLGYYAQGSTVTGSNFTATLTVASSTVAASFNTTRTLTFASGGDAARYFFNAGGRVTLVITATNNNGTARSQDFQQLFQSNIASSYFQANFSVGKTGSGGGNVTNATNLGYYSLTSGYQTLANVQPSGQAYTYSNDWVRVQVKTNGTVGTAGDTGSTITFQLDAASPAQTNSNFNDAVSVTVTTRIDVTPPETTYLANTWGVFGVT
jgi:hypothetical protein